LFKQELMGYNTKIKGNKAEAVIMSQFVRNNIPVLLPFGDNEKYDLVIELNNQFKSVQIKYGRYESNCVAADIRHRIGVKRIDYETYFDKVDFIAIWCETNDKSYLLPLQEFGNKTQVRLRLNPPINNSCISTVCWARDYEFDLVLSQQLLK